MQADLELGRGQAHDAETLATEVLSDPGPDHRNALISLIAARAAQRLPVQTDMVAELETFVEESRGDAVERPLAEAIFLARALSGDFDGAFQALPDFPEHAETIWSLLATLAPDDTFLAHAVLAQATARPKLAKETSEQISRRLLGVGLGAAASQWLDGLENVDSILEAEIALQNRDGRKALNVVDRLDDGLATPMRARAFDLLGSHEQSAEIYRDTGDSASEVKALAMAENWQNLAAKEPGVWQSLAAEVVAANPVSGDTPPSGGALAEGKSLLESAEGTRTGIKALLSQVAQPPSVSE